MNNDINNEKYDWLMAAQSYLLTSHILAKELLKVRDFSGTPFLNSSCFKINNFPPHPSYELIMPIVFNLKHGIELWLKGISFITTGKYNSKDHNSVVLFDEIFSIAVIPQNIKDDIKNIQSIVNKYNKISDENNILFRYPNKDKAKRLDKINDVTPEWVCEIIDDSLFLNTKFRNIYKQIKDFELNKSSVNSIN